MDGEGHSEIADLGLAAQLGWEAYSFMQQPSLRINKSPRGWNGSANHLTKKGQSVASKTEKRSLWENFGKLSQERVI